jgi:hypothetical protein
MRVTLAAFVGEPSRISRSLVRRTEQYYDLPLVALAAIVEIRRCLDEIEDKAIEAAREKGATWEEIAESAGVTRQAIYQRYRHHHPSSARTP